MDGCLENDDLENDDLENNDLENDEKDGVARRIKGLEGYRRREIRGREEGIMKGWSRGGLRRKIAEK